MHIDHNPTPSNDARRRKRSVIGVTAGVVAGGAIGLFAVAPVFSSAATPDAPALQEPDDDVSDPGSDDAETSARPEPGERVRESLQALVDDGTIDAGQADAVAAHLAEQRPERGDGGPGHGKRDHRPGLDGEVVAELIGIDAATLRERLRSGSSIADIAEANGVEPQTVVDALFAEGAEHLDLAVESGRLTEEEAAEKLATLDERVTERVNGERPDRP